METPSPTGVPSGALPPGALDGFSLNNTVGAALLGTYFSLILYGGILHQTSRYYRIYVDDTLWLKALIFVAVALESAQTALCIYACYYMLIIGYANPSVLEHASLSENMLPVVSGAIIALTQATGIKSTDTLMDRLILYTVTNGLITSTCMLILFIFVLVQPTSMVYVAMSFVSTKLYTNTLLAALNTRKSLRGTAANPSGIEIFMSGEEHHPQGVPLPSQNTVTLEFADVLTRSDGSKA
ncbi:hypothetical protein V8D89_006770 [Ganoderma adspersum]